MEILTIFTPTFNRAYILPDSYNTLKEQTCKDFIWVIVDDGSTDNTEELVKKWITEGTISIEYYKTENRGKPSATNLSIEKCHTPLWVCLDSDDHFGVDAVETIIKDYLKVKDEGTYGGIVGNMFTENGDIFDGQCLPNDIENIKDLDIRYKYGVYSNLLHVFWTDVLKQYQYPIIQNEKFIGESYLYEKMNVLYYIERKPLYYAKYREDGLTASYLKLHVQNPKGYKLLKEQVMQLNIPLYHRFRGAIMYVAACILCGDNNIVRKSKCKGLTMLAFPFGCFAYYRKYRSIKKLNK